MKAPSNLIVVRKNNLMVLHSNKTNYEQWIESDAGPKDFSRWLDFSGLANCFGVEESEVLLFFQTEIDFPKNLLPKKYREGAV